MSGDRAVVGAVRKVSPADQGKNAAGGVVEHHDGPLQVGRQRENRDFRPGVGRRLRSAVGRPPGGPPRPAERHTARTAAGAAVGGAIAAVTSDDPRLLQINEILDEKVRPALMGDGGYLEVLGLKDHTLSIRYQGACGSCPSSLTGTLMAIEGMLKQEVDPEMEVIAV